MSDSLPRAKALRRSATDAEQALWYHLRAHRFMGLKFKRQKPIGPYIADFVCIEYGLVIELDGGQHVEQTQYDEARTTHLNQSGFTVLRFWNHEILLQMSEVLERIRMFVVDQPSPPTPLLQAGEGSKPSDCT